MSLSPNVVRGDAELNLPNTQVMVESLFNICTNFVARHIDSVDSLVGFPEQVGKQIFEKFAEQYLENDVSDPNAFAKFSDAYEHLVLKKLDLSDNLLVLNEHLETIIVIARYVTELCVCDCSLGENHEILKHICEFQRLQKLCLRDNCMNDTSLRLLTFQMRIYGLGGKDIRTLNLGGNAITDYGLHFLRAFPNVEFLNLVGSSISEAGVEMLANRFNLIKILPEEFPQHQNIVNEGWASVFLQQWNKRKQRWPWYNPIYISLDLGEHKYFSFKQKVSRIKSSSVMPYDVPNYNPHKMSDSTLLVFQKKAPSQELSSVPPSSEKRKILKMCEKEIEDDIFSGYKITQ